MDDLPKVPCPTCGESLSVTRTECWACGSSFGGRDLWDLWERAHATA